MLNGFWKNGVPNHELILKVGNICLVTHAINVLGLANNSRVRIIDKHRYCVKVLTVGDCTKQNVRIPHISFKFRLPYGKSYQLTRLQFPLHLAYSMTYNKSQSQTLFKVLLDITSPPFSHAQLYVALSQVCDCKNIVVYLTKEQLTIQWFKTDESHANHQLWAWGALFVAILLHRRPAELCCGWIWRGCGCSNDTYSYDNPTRFWILTVFMLRLWYGCT